MLWTFLATYTALPLAIIGTAILLVVWLINSVVGALNGGGPTATVDPRTGRVVAVTSSPGISLGDALGLMPSALSWTLRSALLVGVIALALIYGGLVMEPTSLRWQGFRRPTMAERVRLDRAMAAIQRDMRLSNLPVVWVWDTPEPVAAARSRSIIVSSALVNLPTDDRGEALLRGVLAHELIHWRRADYLADRAVWAVGWLPLLMYRMGGIIGGWDPSPRVNLNKPPPQQRIRNGFGALIGVMLFWPAWVIVRLVILPLSMAAVRRDEYEADRQAVVLGGQYLAGLREFLAGIGSMDFAVAGWQAVLQRTHPPVALRIERLDWMAAERQARQSQYEAAQQRPARPAPVGEPELGPPVPVSD